MMDKKTIISAFRVAVAAACAISALSYGEEDPASIQHRYMTPSMRVSTNAWLSVSRNVERIVSAATNGLATKAEVEAHVTDINNPHSVTAAQVGALPLIEDSTGAKTAVTIGSRKSDGAVGASSLANGNNVTASGQGSHAEGLETVASGVYSHADGMFTEALGPGSYALGYMTKTLPSHRHAFVWNGYGGILEKYTSNDEGTFNINPIGGLDGFYIGEKTLAEIFYTKEETDAKVNAIGDKADEAYSAAEQMVDAVNSLSGTVGSHIRDTKNPHKVTAAQVGAYTRAEVDSKIESAVLPTDPTFSNAVLSVGLNIDTKSVAVLNEIASTFGGFPIEGTATTVGGLLAALAAAVAWLKKNKVQTLKLNDGSVETSANGGVAKLDDFFTESNSLLTATIDARLPYPINAVPSTGVLKDRAINTTSLASVTVPDNFTDLLIRASVASSLSVTMPESIATKYGDTFPGEAGDYLITITKTGASEAYVRTIKLEVA